MLDHILYTYFFGLFLFFIKDRPQFSNVLDLPLNSFAARDFYLVTDRGFINAKAKKPGAQILAIQKNGQQQIQNRRIFFPAAKIIGTSVPSIFLLQSPNRKKFICTTTTCMMINFNFDNRKSLTFESLTFAKSL